MLSRRDFLYLAGALPAFAQSKNPKYSTGVDVVNVLTTVRARDGYYS